MPHLEPDGDPGPAATLQQLRIIVAALLLGVVSLWGHDSFVSPAGT